MKICYDFQIQFVDTFIFLAILFTMKRIKNNDIYDNKLFFLLNEILVLQVKDNNIVWRVTIFFALTKTVKSTKQKIDLSVPFYSWDDI